jgi:hypothetical protein
MVVVVVVMTRARAPVAVQALSHAVTFLIEKCRLGASFQSESLTLNLKRSPCERGLAVRIS